MVVDTEALACAERVFAYHQLHHQPRQSDVLIVLGTNDTRVASFAADLYLQGLAPQVIVTGGMAHENDLLATNWDRSEAEVFADIMLQRGVPEASIRLERRARNTAQNISYSKLLIGDPAPASILYACKPFMPRRVYATHAVEWPEVPATVATWPCTFVEYCNDELPQDKILHIMLGDLQRIWVYARRGYAASQHIPPDVMQAYRRLVELGFTQHLICEE